MVIRRARADDAEAFVRAHERAWDASIADIVGKRLGDLAPFAARVDAFRAGIGAAPEDAGAWVAEDAGEIVGVAMRVGSELRDLYVVPSAWGTGVAQKLLESALAGKRGEVVLWVGEDNARARRFYEREGWTPDGEARASSLGPVELRYRRTRP